ncbi:MAG: nuclear transport factor 2 family protein [Bacteroidetes bacterium]|nr:nuclear transport factor 2 family protein [Bacteroidota bacterium]
MSLARIFYTAFQNRDWKTMQACYHDKATFSDPAFPDLNSTEVKAMWKMLVTRGKDLTIKFEIISESEDKATVKWIADYTFSRSGRKVNNIIVARMEFLDGKILKHTDQFSFYRWSRQALGLTGLLLGWTPFLQKKVQSNARQQLVAFMEKEPKS